MPNRLDPKSWSWTPGDHPRLPGRVQGIEVMVEHLYGEVSIMRRWLIAAALAGWGIAAELLYLIATTEGVL